MKKRTLAIIASGIVVAGLAVGGYFLLNQKDENNAIEDQSQPVSQEDEDEECENKNRSYRAYSIEKPVIYMYSDQEEDIQVKLNFNGTLTKTIPEYKDGWKATTCPDGQLLVEGKKYPYLFWEGTADILFNMSEGFSVAREETDGFLTEKLGMLGLNEKEMADFKEYWLPYLNASPYNTISFQFEEYTDNAELLLSKTPDTLIRVFMAYYPTETKENIKEQTLDKCNVRSGFTVVEWGGGEIKK